jgi:hypothetical protein
LYKELSDDQMINKMYDRHLKRQMDINYSYAKL